MTKINKSKIFQTLLSILLVLLLMVGCTPTISQDPDSTVEPTPTKGTQNDTSDTEEPMKISIAMWELSEFGNDPVGESIEKELNIDVEAILLEWSDWSEKIKLWAASDELPDCIATTTVADSKRFYSWVDEELIREIPEDLIDKFPHTKIKMDNNSILNMTREVTGGTYYIPRPETMNNVWTANQTYMLYRKDWMENLGISEMPEDMDSLYEVLKQFTVGDPDQNGVDDTYGLTGNYGTLYACFNAHPFTWVEEDGNVIPGYLSNDMVDALKWFRKLFSEGILDPELKTDDAKFAQNTFGAYLKNLDAWWAQRTVVEIFGEANKELGDPLEVVGIMGPFAEKAGSEKMWSPLIQTSGTEISYNVSDEKLEKILQLDNYLVSPEGNDLRYWGIKDIDYSVDAAGNYKKLNDDVLRTKYPSIFIQNWPTWDWEWNADESNSGNPDISIEVKQFSGEARERYNKAFNLDKTKIRLDAAYIFTPAREKFMFDYQTTLINIITGTDDVETMFDTMVSDAYAAGVQTVIDEANAYLNQ